MGRYEPLLIDPYEQANDDSNILTLKDKFSKLVLSATDTEMTHVTLHDLLPDNKYFRFNPYLSGKFWKIWRVTRKPLGYIAQRFFFFQKLFLWMKRELKRSVWCGMTPKCTVVAMWEGWTWCQSWQQPSQHIFKEAKESWESPWRITTTTLWQQQLGKSQLYWLPKWLQLQIHTLPVYLVCIKPRNKRLLWSLK